MLLHVKLETRNGCGFKSRPSHTWTQNYIWQYFLSELRFVKRFPVLSDQLAAKLHANLVDNDAGDKVHQGEGREKNEDDEKDSHEGTVHLGPQKLRGHLSSHGR